MLVCATTVPAVAGDQSRKLTPRGNPGNWFNNDDYPPVASRARESGAVRFELAIGTDGKPESCRILESSKSKALDDQTCLLAMERGQFLPALDAGGKPQRDVFSSRVRWVLGDPLPVAAGAAWRSGAVLRVDRSGKVKSCEGQPDFGVLPDWTGNACKSLSTLGPDVLLGMIGDSKTVGGEISLTFETAFVRDGVGAPAMDFQGHGQTTVQLLVVHFDIDAQGKPTNCKVIRQEVLSMNICEIPPGSFAGPGGGSMTVAISRPAGM